MQQQMHSSKLPTSDFHLSSRVSSALYRSGGASLVSRRRLQVVARLTARGSSVSAQKITLKKVLGEGSYGTVFEVRLDLSVLLPLVQQMVGIES
jgi:hypothetical protein